MNAFRTITGSLLCVILLAGCAGSQEKSSTIKAREFQVKDLAKSDVDMVAEAQQRFTLELLHALMEKLYKRNPREWRKSGAVSLDVAVARVFGPQRSDIYPELDGKRSVAAVRLAFDPGYHGDRVLAFVEGLRSMVIASYGGKREIFITDELDPQKLYNGARNFEIAAWKLNTNRDPEGRFYLVGNETAGSVKNLSFERLFGKMIGLQDSAARIVAEKSNRRIKSVIQSLASAVFLPI
ncbi:MAG: hypothetical protein ABW146_12500 [Candidatus Sedimenticola sp. 6PFRAG7]